MDNSRAERFRRVAGPRVQRVLDSIDNLSKCSNRNNYEYTLDDVEKMMKAIKARIKGLESQFEAKTGSGSKNSFSF